ncbi:hypothetical protein KY285_024183 [Solanum tuberosum]|nr:hypothetical protein KY289_024521 [Solanum tuberosum]KAH0673171.1 hypothetical protein KY284_024258 [Solanum tuberosum]KAH0676382.1 hypothetical protein KY285_024183 [Solanum tuberosum]
MTVRCCYCGIYVELKTSRTPTNPRRMFWGCQKYSSGNGCGFFRWADAMIQHAKNNTTLRIHQRVQCKEDKEDKQDIEDKEGK